MMKTFSHFAGCLAERLTGKSCLVVGGISAAVLGVSLSPSAGAQSSTRTTVLKAPVISLALPGTSASVHINSSSGSPPPGDRTVVISRPLLAMPVWPFKAHIGIASSK